MSSHVLPGVVPRLHTPYEHLIRRIHQQINSSAAQVSRRTIIVLQPGESADDWDAFLDQLDVEESVKVTHIERGSARLEWTNQHRSQIAFA